MTVVNKQKPPFAAPVNRVVRWFFSMPICAVILQMPKGTPYLRPPIYAQFGHPHVADVRRTSARQSVRTGGGCSRLGPGQGRSCQPRLNAFDALAQFGHIFGLLKLWRVGQLFCQQSVYFFERLHSPTEQFTGKLGVWIGVGVGVHANVVGPLGLVSSGVFSGHSLPPNSAISREPPLPGSPSQPSIADSTP